MKRLLFLSVSKVLRTGRRHHPDTNAARTVTAKHQALIFSPTPTFHLLDAVERLSINMGYSEVH
ncbi:hypothetical protein AN958_12614 [Leucoagaricus sp. SymC.cos]|nr:hypothetical protein AN958_12614 [Leucoagaricus sp. SymC.cos]